MKNSNWYVSISAGKYCFLFPHSGSSSGMFSRSCREISRKLDFDEMVLSEFGFPVQDGKKFDILFDDESLTCLSSSLIPSVVEIDSSEVCEVPLVMRDKMKAHGIVAVFFEKGTVYFVFSISDFMRNSF